MASISDVAKLAGVSKSTVSLVCNNKGYVSPETREKIERAMAELNYTPSALGQNLKRHGAVTKMKSLVSELMQYQVTGEDLELWRERAKEKPLLALKLQDIRCIYQAFEEYPGKCIPVHYGVQRRQVLLDSY